MCHFLLVINIIVPEAVSCTVYEIWLSIGPPSLYFATLLAFNVPTKGFLWNDLRKILHGGQMMAKVHSGEEMLPKASTP